ncbi:MAG: deoxyribose-phosphate aldolase [Planctomycetota bacterium]|jgi:deoxyribose-phosphate aldolase
MPAPPRTVDAATLEETAAARAARGLAPETAVAGMRLALGLLDLTTLTGADTPRHVRALCARARRPGGAGIDIDPPLPPVAAVCVHPALVAEAVAALDGSPVRVASVAGGFPAGQTPLDVRLAEIAAVVDAGADEVDLVLGRNAFLSGRRGVAAAELRAARQACGPARLKVILETGELGDYDAIRRAADLVLDAVADEDDLDDGDLFLKTSTGTLRPAATLPACLVLAEAAGDHARATGVRVGLKPAGGIRTADTALAFLCLVRETLGDAWLAPRLLRLGASALADDLVGRLVAAAAPAGEPAGAGGS